MSFSKIVLVCLSVAVLVAAASASECQAAANQYVANYNSEHRSAFKLLEVSACHNTAGNNYYMSLIMTNAVGQYVSCLDISTSGASILSQGTCY